MARKTDLTRRKIISVAGMGGLAAGAGLVAGTGLIGPPPAQAQEKKKKGANKKGERKYPRLEHAIESMEDAKDFIQQSLDSNRNFPPERRKLREKAITAIEVAIIDLKMIVQSD